MEKEWLRQLHIEFEDICQSYGIGLRSPIFEISGGRKELGSWCADSRRLRISRHLIVNYPWSVTLQVLKHEMAHQLCNEIFCETASPHGAPFARACELLGVLPEYRRSTIIIETMVADLSGPASSQGQKCVDRVKKLLALAESSNEHEAGLAMQKANELITRYHLADLQTVTEHRYGSCIIDRKKKRIERYQNHICHILGEFFFVRSIILPLYDPQRDDTYRTIELLGTPENVAIAEYCYYFLENHLAMLWRNKKMASAGQLRAKKNSYYLGILRGFYLKLEAQRAHVESGGESRAALGELVVAEDRRLKEHVGMRYPQLRKAYSKRATVNSQIYEEGIKAGKTLSFNHGVDSPDNAVRGYLS